MSAQGRVRGDGVRVWVGQRGLRATAPVGRPGDLCGLHDQLCGRLRDAAPYPIGPVHVCGLGRGTLTVDARRLS